MHHAPAPTPLYWLRARRFGNEFPPLEEALSDPNGLLAAGGDLDTERLLDAYRRGIFPWYSRGEPLLWWSPDPRTVLKPDELHISKSLRKTLRRGGFRITADQAFARVVHACQGPRRGNSETWITAEMAAAYTKLHALGYAHSVECWHDERLSGGLYGVAIGQVFFGESMFNRVRDSSKITLVYLAAALRRWNYRLIDCQVHNAHLESLGAYAMPRDVFQTKLRAWCHHVPATAAWTTPQLALDAARQ